MGQARRRGTFEERREQAVARADAARRAEAEARESRRLAELERWESLTDDQRRKELERPGLNRAMMAAVLLAGIGGYGLGRHRT